MVNVFFDTDEDYRPEISKNLCCIFSCTDIDGAIDFLEAMVQSAQEEIKKLGGVVK